MASDAERIIDLYQRHSQTWDRERARSLFERPWLDRFLALLPAQATILDIGCGGGEPLARYFIENGCNLTGVDSSPTLISICQQRFPDQRWIVADMRALSLQQRFDGILAWDSFFHLCAQDQRRMFSIFTAHAAARATLMFTSGSSYGEAIGNYQGEPLYHASLDSDEYRSLLHQNGFDVVEHVIEDQACGHHTIWLAQCDRQQ